MVIYSLTYLSIYLCVPLRGMKLVNGYLYSCWYFRISFKYGAWGVMGHWYRHLPGVKLPGLVGMWGEKREEGTRELPDNV